MKSSASKSKANFGLGAALVMVFVLVLLNLMINFSGSMHAFVSYHLQSPVIRLIVNILFLWVLVVLWVTYARWRVLATNEQELESIISGINLDVLLVIGRDRGITVCNDSVKRIFGWEPARVIGQKTDFLYFDRRQHPDHPREIYEALEQDGYHYGLASGVHRDGHVIPLEIITGQLKDRGGAVLLIRDISERVAMQKEKERLEERSRQARRLQSLGMLAGGIAHDFRNILTVVRGHAELALRKQDPGSLLYESLKEIMGGADRAHDLCQNLLAFAGRAPRKPQKVSLNALTDDTVNMLRIKLPDTTELRCELDDAQPMLEADEVQLRQVVMNIVSNAMHAVQNKESGCITVATGVEYCTAARLEELCLEDCPAEGDYLFVRVSDTGCGMDEETRKKVFEPFFSTKRQGHGMGMAAVMGIVRSHGGVIDVESTPGEGSVFTVFLPEKAALQETEAD